MSENDPTDPYDLLDEVLESCLEKFLPEAPVVDPAYLRWHLPEEDGAPRRFVLGELIKLDMAAHAEKGHDPRLERYVEAFPDLLPQDDVPFDLVIEEFQLRRETGSDPQVDDYARRFPQHADKLGQFGCDVATVSPTGVTKAPMEVGPGDTLDDFSILQPLGEGAFARVYLARQESMQRLVALKVSAGKGDESQALAQLDHANIVRVFDQRHTADGAHLLYMQYQPGGTLADVVRVARETDRSQLTGQVVLDVVDHKLLEAAQLKPEASAQRAWLADAPWPVVVAWMGGQLARALDHAHQGGVLHRDVKPANVLLSAEGAPKLADFNVSLAGAAGRAGAASKLGGSIGYLAPEHLSAMGGLPDAAPEDVREPADFYSLAVLLWELWQGRRPFVVRGTAVSWVDALAQQILSREEELAEPERLGDASERVLEGVLRTALSADPAERPGTGAEFAGRLRLALHPAAADVFDPPSRSWRRWIADAPVVLVLTVAALGPNIAAGAFNYYYNRQHIVVEHGGLRGEELERFTEDFVGLSTVVNSIAFPLGGLLLLYFARPVVQALRSKASDQRALDELFALSSRAAVIGGSMWGIASVVFPWTLSTWHDTFTTGEATNFCLSLLLCGGAAAVYPYFLLSVLAAAVYYPRLVGKTMTDPEFDRRGAKLHRDAGGYLIAATAIPLLAVALLVSQELVAKDIIRVALVASIVGLIGSFSAYRYLQTVWERMAPVLSSGATTAQSEP